MKLNKKYFLTIFTALGIQALYGINLANAYCEKEVETLCNLNYLNRTNPKNHQICISDLQKDVDLDIRIFSNRKIDEIQTWINKEQKYMTPQSSDERSKINALGWAKRICTYKAAIATNQASNNTNSQVSQSDDSVTNALSTTANQPNQQNSSPEEVERSNMKNNYSQKTAAYEQKYQGRGKKHNIDAFANQCIKTKGRKVLNTCNFDVEVVFCAKNPDPNSKHAFEMANGFDCARNSKGMWGISANSALMGVFTADSVSVFACKKPSLPGAEVDPQTLSLVGRCSEY